MKKNVLFSFLLMVTCIGGFSQTLYTNSTSGGTVYNPGLSTAGNPKIIFDDANIPSAQVAGSDSISITRVKFGLYRFASAPAITVKFYYTPPNPTATSYDNFLKLPPVLIGTTTLTANGTTAGNTIISLGDSVTSLFKVKTDTGFIYTGYQTVFLGVSFSIAGAASNTTWRTATPTQSFNDDAIWIYNPDSTVQQYASYFSGNPPATFYLQVFGRPTGGVFPVEISDFKGIRKGNVNTLNWTTVTEINNSGFELQRSADGTNFSKLAFIASKAITGNSNAALSYSFDDLKPLMSNGYYRLKQIDKDGKSTLSNIVLIKGNKANALTVSTIYPNPVTDNINLIITAAVQQTVTVIILDLSGKILNTKLHQATTGDNSIQINTAKLAAGTYLLKASNSNGEASVQKFIKQ